MRDLLLVATALTAAACSFTPGGGTADARRRSDGGDGGDVDAAVATDRVVELAVGDAFACARHGGGEVKCWGRGSSGQLGQGDDLARGNAPGELGAALPPIPLGGPARALAVGWSHACAIVDRGADVVVCWGNNDFGKLGLGDLDHRGDAPGELDGAVVPLPTPAVAIAAGWDHTCAIDGDGAVRCWGKNDVGQLGQGDTDPRGDQPGELANLAAIPLPQIGPVRQLALGEDHTCVVGRTGAVACWGDNGEGELGVGSTVPIGDAPGEMATLAPVPLGDGTVGRAVSAGDDLVCAVRGDSAATCWGRGSNGRLGIEASGGDHRGDAPGEVPLPAPIALPGPVSALSAGRGGHACVVVAAGAYCWGDGGTGQLGRDSTTTLGDMAGEMALVTAAPIALAGPVGDVSAGLDHTCALLEDGRVQCWGSNDSGQLGTGDMTQRGDDVGEMATLGVIDLGW